MPDSPRTRSSQSLPSRCRTWGRVASPDPHARPSPAAAAAGRATLPGAPRFRRRRPPRFRPSMPAPSYSVSAMHLQAPLHLTSAHGSHPSLLPARLNLGGFLTDTAWIAAASDRGRHRSYGQTKARMTEVARHRSSGLRGLAGLFACAHGPRPCVADMSRPGGRAPPHPVRPRHVRPTRADEPVGRGDSQGEHERRNARTRPAVCQLGEAPGPISPCLGRGWPEILPIRQKSAFFLRPSGQKEGEGRIRP